jgi:hypothetical protein
MIIKIFSFYLFCVFVEDDRGSAEVGAEKDEDDENVDHEHDPINGLHRKEKELLT